jgi:WD40 repeat protein
MKGTRRDVLLQLENWLNDEEDKRVFWLNGLAGTGKSTIAQTFAQTSFVDGKLGASFFCSRYYDDRNNLQTIFPTLAFQLAHRFPRFLEALLPVLTKSPDVGREVLCTQMEKLIVHPFQETQIATLIIIDALDECRDEEPESALLSILSRYLDKIPFVKFFITGRPEARIRSGFRLKSLRPHTEVFKLHEVERPSVDKDIRLFFKVELTEIGKNRSDCNLPEEWPSSAELDALCVKAAHLFIYAATVVKFVASQDHQPTRRLTDIIALPHDTTKEGRAGIDQLYTEVLKQAFLNIQADDGEFYSSFQSVVGAVVLVHNPLSVPALSDLLGVSNVSTTLRSLHSLINIPTDQPSPIPIHVLHKSFPDFLIDPKRCKDNQLLIDPVTGHRDILLLCLKLMKQRLKKDICQLDGHGPLSAVKDLPERRKAYIGDALGYSCSFWASHLAKTATSNPVDEEVHEAIDEFFKTCFLFWIEVLSLLMNLDAGVYALSEIAEWYTEVSLIWSTCQRPLMFIFIQSGDTCKWIEDSKHIMLEYFDIISESPCHIYSSALPLCPASSWLQKYYSSELSQVVKPVKGVLAEWIACSRTVLFSGFPTSISYAKNTIAIGSDYGTIIILDAVTGSQRAEVSAHERSVICVAFSSDGRSLVSGGVDTNVKLWDVQTGGIVETFYGHTKKVWAVSISPDCTRIVSGSEDKTIRLWDIETSKCCQSIRLRHEVSFVCFLPSNPKHLVSISNDKIKQWDVNGKKIGPVLDGFKFIFPSDFSQFATCDDGFVTIWSSKTGAIVTELEFPGNCELSHCCFSPDGRLIAVSSENIAYVWNVSNPTPYLVGKITVQFEGITSIVFSSPSILVSTSNDYNDDTAVEFWQISDLSMDTVSSSTNSALSCSTSIMFVSLQVNPGIAISGDAKGILKTWDISNGFCKATFQTPAFGHYSGDAKMIDGRLLFIWSSDRKIHIWDNEKDEHSKKPEMPQSSTFRISDDGSKFFVMDCDECTIQAWSVWTWELVGRVKWEEEGYDLGSFHAHGSKIWIHSQKLSANKGWDFGVLGSPIQLPNTERPRLEFITGHSFETIPYVVKDTATGKEVFKLPTKTVKLLVSRWDGQYLVAGYENGEVLILDFCDLLSQ